MNSTLKRMLMMSMVMSAMTDINRPTHREMKEEPSKEEIDKKKRQLKLSQGLKEWTINGLVLNFEQRKLQD